MVVGFVLTFFGIVLLGITIVSYRKYNRVSPISLSSTLETSFNIEVKGEYAICVEGVNHHQVTTEMIELKNLKSNETIDIETIEQLSLKNQYQRKFYHNIFKFNIDRPCKVKVTIPAYTSLKTHHSKYKLVDKYSIAKPPIILIHRFYPIAKRLRFIIFFIGCLFLIPIGMFLIFKS